MIIDSEDGDLYTVRDFIAANWSAFVAHVQDHGVSPTRAHEEAQRIYEAIGGEPE